MPKGQHIIPGWLKGEAHGRAVLTTADVIEIRTAWRDLPKELVHGFVQFMADRHGVSIGPIQQILDKQTWKDVEIEETVQPLDKELLAELLQRRADNSAARRAARIYQGEHKCSVPVREPHSTKRQNVVTRQQHNSTKNARDC
jgi:hypothetical protein